MWRGGTEPGTRFPTSASSEPPVMLPEASSILPADWPLGSPMPAAGGNQTQVVELAPMPVDTLRQVETPTHNATQSPFGVRWIDNDPVLYPPQLFGLDAVQTTQKVAASSPWSSIRAACGLCIRTEERDGTARMFLSGELDMATAPLVEKSLAAAQGDHEAVVVDLEELTFMGATGLHIFLNAAKRASDKGSRFGIVNSHAPVRRVFEVTRTDFLLG
jgi:anti-sigma B factor antagonist